MDKNRHKMKKQVTDTREKTGHTRNRLLPAIMVILLGSFIYSYGNSYGLTTTKSHVPQVTTWPDEPLATSVTGRSSSAVVLPMGEQNNVSDRFWQLFYTGSSPGKWQNVIGKVGVATDGGLTVYTTSRTKLLLLVQPTIFLKFSPVDIVTVNPKTPDKNTYTPLDPLLSKTLPTPSDLTQTSKNTFIAIAKAKDGLTYLVDAGKNTNWRDLKISTKSSSPCANSEITAISQLQNILLIGLGCPGINRQYVEYQNGLVKNNALQVTNFGFPSQAAMTGSFGKKSSKANLSNEILLFSRTDHISPTGSYTFSVLDAVIYKDSKKVTPKGFDVSLFGIKNAQNPVISMGKNTTKQRSFLTVAPDDQVLSVGRYQNYGYFILTKAPRQNASLFLWQNAEGNWLKIGNLPPHTVTVVKPNNGPLESFSTDKKHLLIYDYYSKHNKWVISQNITVALQYGSSG